MGPLNAVHLQTICCFLVFVAIANCAIPTFRIEPQDVQVESGDEINLQCAFDQPATNCYWKKNGTFQNNTFQFTGDKTSGNCSILITGNTDEAQGSWQCGTPQSETMDSILSKEAKVKINGPTPSFRSAVSSPRRNVFSQEPEDTTVRSGDNTFLKCIFNNDNDLPVNSCYWETDGGVIGMGGRYALTGNVEEGDCSISITNANIKFDNSRWFCGLPQSDKFGKAVISRKANLTVAVAPKDPKILQEGIEQLTGTDLGVQFNQVLDLTCEAENGNPEATLKWTILDSDLGGTVVISPVMNGRLKTATNKLSVNVLPEWKDQQLKCTSSHPSYDDGREHSTYVNLRDFQKTSKVSIVCQNSTNLNRTITLKANEKGEFTCNGDGVPQPEYRWQALTNGKWEKLMDNIQNLTVFSTSQTIRCIASNDGFQSYASSQSWSIVGTQTSGTNSITGTHLVAFILTIWIAKHIL